MTDPVPVHVVGDPKPTQAPGRVTADRVRVGMDFSDALRYIKAGRKVQRAGWNGKGMHLELVIPYDPVNLPYVQMWTADRRWVPWLCSQTDLLANDWQEVL